MRIVLARSLDKRGDGGFEAPQVFRPRQAVVTVLDQA